MQKCSHTPSTVHMVIVLCPGTGSSWWAGQRDLQMQSFSNMPLDSLLRFPYCCTSKPRQPLNNNQQVDVTLAAVALDSSGVVCLCVQS